MSKQKMAKPLRRVVVTGMGAITPIGLTLGIIVLASAELILRSFFKG